MNKSRLLKLADLLEANAANPKGVKFDLDFWGGVDDAPFTNIPETVPLDCQTTACAVGLACISGTFKDEGLTYDLQSKEDGGGNNFTPLYAGETSFEAVKSFFEITHNQSDYLFLMNSYEPHERQSAEGERAVAERIRELVSSEARP